MKSEEERAEIMSIFNNQVLNTKKKEITKNDLSYFKPLFESITDSELENTLIPSFIRAMKRNAIVYII